MARHLAPFSCRQTIAEIVRRRSWGGGLPLGRDASIRGSRSIHAPSVSIALSSFQEGQNARHHNQFKIEQALGRVDGFDDDEAKSECDEGCKVLVRFLAAECNSLEALELAHKLLDTGAGSIECLREESRPVLGR